MRDPKPARPGVLKQDQKGSHPAMTQDIKGRLEEAVERVQVEIARAEYWDVSVADVRITDLNVMLSALQSSSRREAAAVGALREAQETISAAWNELTCCDDVPWGNDVVSFISNLNNARCAERDRAASAELLLRNLNTAVDDYWNNGRAERYVWRVTEAQQQCRSALQAVEGGKGVKGSSVADIAASVASQPDCSTAQHSAGWRLVPYEPTEAMVDAARYHWGPWIDAAKTERAGRYDPDAGERERAVWEQMLAAAPLQTTLSALPAEGEEGEAI